MSVDVFRNGSVTTITINRPEVRNAIDGPTASALLEAFRAFESDPLARVAVLHGANGVFSAGADLKAMATGERTLELSREHAPLGPSRMLLSKPLIAAVAGYAVAGGLELALLADLRIAERGAVFGVFNRRWGIPLIDGGTVRLPRIVGLGRALDLVLSGRPVDAAEALAIGLVNRVVEDGEALSAAQELARQIAAFPQEALLADRSNCYSSGLSLEEALLREFDTGSVVFKSVPAERLAERFAAGEGRHGKFEG